MLLVGSVALGCRMLHFSVWASQRRKSKGVVPRSSVLRFSMLVSQRKVHLSVAVSMTAGAGDVGPAIRDPCSVQVKWKSRPAHLISPHL
jgi:hypothetical protein